jgi:hypothetical protein
MPDLGRAAEAPGSIFTGLDAVAATSRFLWNATALITNGAIRALGGLLLRLAKGIGWRALPPSPWAWALAIAAAFS